MSRIILLRHSSDSTSFYCHCMAILLPFYLYDISQTYVKLHLGPGSLCCTVVQTSLEVSNYRMVLDPSFTLSAHHMHSNALSAPQVLKFAPNAYMSHVLFHVVGMLIFFLFEMSIQTLNEVAAAPFSLECPCCVAVSPTHCSKPLLFPSPLRSVCSRVAFLLLRFRLF